MSFARIWTSLLAGTCAAVPATLCYAVGTAQIAQVAALERDALTPSFLMIWGVSAVCCAVPARARNQWLMAIGGSAALLGLLCLLVLLTSRSAVTLAVSGTLCGLLVLLGVAIVGPDRRLKVREGADNDRVRRS